MCIMYACMHACTYARMNPCQCRLFQQPEEQQHPLKPADAKPVVAFIKDPMVKKVSPNSDSSASDSGRGHSSEEGDTLRRTQPLNRHYDFSPTFSKTDSPAAATACISCSASSSSSAAAAAIDEQTRGIDAKGELDIWRWIAGSGGFDGEMENTVQNN